MALKIGIVGLPNVGKSTLFNALTRTAAAQAANFPFCTIEPNVGEVNVPDPRLDRLAAIAKSAKVVPARITFVDIAGLVRGASKGEGLGNQFLANIRECDAIAHVLRCFEDPDVAHVEGRVEPLADAETVETELMLADLESVEKRLGGLARKLKGGDKEAAQQARLLEAAKAALEAGRPARTVAVAEEDARAWRLLQLLTAKPVLYVCNVEEASAATGNVHSAAVAKLAAAEGAGCVVISAAIEEEIAQLDDAERAEFLAAIGLEEAGLDRLMHDRRPEGGPGLDDPGRRQRAAGCRRDPRRLREGLHPGRDHRLRRLPRARRRAGGEGGGADALGGQGLPGAGRRRDALPVQCVILRWGYRGHELGSGIPRLSRVGRVQRRGRGVPRSSGLRPRAGDLRGGRRRRIGAGLPRGRR
jgi:GTP-binding protein YchF